ncbi:unnamed protein product [Phytomonas sp. Hart1]|nr:unnamed protein product [Phytomonas sp. Hart1]|eukprot:CCW68205.1 unnamed protein product [Phytomonas sp. isolate Hart1]
MSKGYAVFPYIKQPRVTVINEALIRSCIYLTPTISTEEDRIRVVNNSEEKVLKDKMKHHVETMDLYDITTLLLSFRHIGRIENLYGFGNLTKLSLDNNHIQKIENLDHLTGLRSLNLSYNAIRVIEGLDSLVRLENLSLFANQIEALSGLDRLAALTTLSLGKNALANLDATLHYLHGCRRLKVLTLRQNPIESVLRYRARLLAFVQTLRFFDGALVSPAEKAKACEEERENLLAIDENDEAVLAAGKARQDEQRSREVYRGYNCPDDTKLFEELLALQPDGYNLSELLRSEVVISFSKDTLERYQNEFNEKAKELTEAMRAVRDRRAAAEDSTRKAFRGYNDKVATASRALIKKFERRVKEAVRLKELEPEGAENVEANDYEEDLARLKKELLMREAEQYDLFESLINNTIAKWRAENADIILQTAFENFAKLEGDFQASLRQVFDFMSEQIQKRDKMEDFYTPSRLDEGLFVLLNSKEEYQKVINEWFDLRRKRLEELELFHLKVEENFLNTKADEIISTERDRHRNCVCEIAEFVDRMSDQILTSNLK